MRMRVRESESVSWRESVSVRMSENESERE